MGNAGIPMVNACRRIHIIIYFMGIPAKFKLALFAFQLAAHGIQQVDPHMVQPAREMEVVTGHPQHSGLDSCT